MINRGYYFEVTEIYTNADMPYYGINGLAVYLTPMSYIEYIDEQYYDIQSGEILESYILIELAEKGFGFQGGYPLGENITEYVNYTSKTEEAYRIPGTFPSYINANANLTGTCAVTAGATAVGYYGRWYPELVPNFTVGREISGAYFYNSQSSAVQPTIEDLYVKMSCNVGGAGTTAEGFRNGIKSYCQSKGKNVSYTNTVSNNQLNLAAYKTLLNEAKPIALFFNTYNMLSEAGITTENNSDKIVRQYYGGMRIVIGFGYRFIQYYSGNTNFRTDYYARVATGLMDMRFGYM